MSVTFERTAAGQIFFPHEAEKYFQDYAPNARCYNRGLNGTSRLGKIRGASHA